jgi:RND family efflux transporter MFP subunit
MSHRYPALALAATLLSLGGCGGHGHDHEAGGHDHGPGGHSHGGGGSVLEPPDQSVTQFGEGTELFVEFPALVQGRRWPFAVHLTRLADYKPLTSGTVTVRLEGAGAPPEEFVQAGPSRPGFFRTEVEPKHVGVRNLTITVQDGELRDVHDLGPFAVYRSIAEALRSEPAEEGEESSDEISFLKEQQWKLDFGLQETRRRTLRASLTANGTLQPRHHGEAWVSAPQEGRILQGEGEFPCMGSQVTKGEELAILAIPLHEGAGDPATMELAVERARVEFSAAERELKRLTGLFEQEAVPERRVIEARSRQDKAWAELQAARRRLENFRAQQRSEGEGAAGRVALRAPIAGTVVGSQVVPGVFVDPGDELFRIVDLDRLWLEVHVPAAHSFRVAEAAGAWFEVEGSDQVFEVTEASGGMLVTVGGVVDPGTRTVPVIFELPNPGRVLRVGMYARVRVLTGAPREALAIPRDAIVEEDGKTVGYVQLGGETFERRVLKLGLRDGDWVEVLEGLDEGDVLVTEGAYYVRLAAAGGAVPSHGHAH